MPDPEPELINGIITRSIIIDYAVLDFYRSHQRVVVSDLGCGFSTRFYRLGFTEAEPWGHFDLPKVLRWRAAMRRMETGELLTGCDLNDLDEKQALAPYISFSGSFTSNNLFIAEGVLNHLTRERAHEVIQILCRRMRGSTLIGTVSMVESVDPMFSLWRVKDDCDLETFLKPATLQKVWVLGKIETRLGLLRPENSKNAAGLVFLAQL
jgi:O-methyltransferase involved in polyketide biosynthesis